MTSAAGRERGLLWLLAVSCAFGPIATLLVVPALPAIRAEFGVSTAAAQSIVSVFLFSFAIGIPFAGPLSDRYGRKPLLLAGLGIFAAGSALGAASPTIGLLIAGRVLQAIGAAITLTVARAAIGDLYQDWRLARALANLTLVVMLGTSFSPLLGGYIAEGAGWHGAFWLLFVGSLLSALSIWRLLPETHAAGPDHRTSFADIGRNSVRVLANPTFTACAIDIGVIYAVYLVFVAAAPFILEASGRPATDLGQFTLLLSAGFFLGNLYVSRRGNAHNMESLARIGSWLQAASALLALGFVLAGFVHPIFWFGPMLPLAFGQGLTLPHRTAVAVRLVPGYAGTASSLIGLAQQTIAALGVQAIGFAPSDTPVPTLVICAALALVSLTTMLYTRNITLPTPQSGRSG